MPVMEGTDLLERIGTVQPQCVRIILTGYADITAAMDAINKGAVWRFLTKPWDDDQFRSTIEAAVEQFNLVEENRRLHVSGGSSEMKQFASTERRAGNAESKNERAK